LIFLRINPLLIYSEVGRFLVISTVLIHQTFKLSSALQSNDEEGEKLPAPVETTGIKIKQR
jgi:hypothetical protein